jgi:RNase adapter protein RapZ
MVKRVVVVSGLSGAGKASILRALEDIGYNAVDNPPLTLLETLITRADQPIAIGLDTRSRGFDADLVRRAVMRLKATPGVRADLVYAWADETALLRRYTETRRRHPMAPQGRVTDGIRAEEALTRPLRDEADLVLDTSELPLADLRRRIEHRYRPGLEEHGDVPGLAVSLVSFAFPAGLPREADMVFDARFLRNPHYDPILRPGTGLDAAVAAYVEADPDFGRFFQGLLDLLTLVIPRFVQEGKKYATIAIGCTGGRHRSVHIAERLARELKASTSLGMDALEVAVTHRELERISSAANSPALSAGSYGRLSKQS